ncbi:hypothetical protein RUM43_014690 [Polyplax serrata]|uniref:Uncharacterized protein n=1 Tax=Polyplax serrata TaxID=468196 RepID=A0AAN8NQ64_POLSC
MDKSDVKVHDSHSDTASVITMKEYAPSEYPSSEPPPMHFVLRVTTRCVVQLIVFKKVDSSTGNTKEFYVDNSRSLPTYFYKLKY